MGLNHGLKKKAQYVLVLISLNAARSFAPTKPLESRLKALMNAYVTQFLLGTLILKEENGSVCVWVAVLTLCWERWE